MQVTEIWRFPVKSLQGERLTEATIGPRGVEGDRGWALFDTESGAHLTARRQPELLFASARLVEGDDGPAVRIALPDGTETDSDHTLSAWLGRPVRLERAEATTVGRFETQADETETGQWFAWEGPEGSFHDSTTVRVSLVSESTLAGWDRRRFRINLIVDAEGDVDLVDRRVAVGRAELSIVKQIGRCVMVTRPQPPHDDDLGPQPPFGRDLDVLRTINRDAGGCLGVGGPVVTPGRVEVGDAVEPLGTAER